VALAAGLWLAASAGPAAQSPPAAAAAAPTRQAADSLARKMLSIADYGRAPLRGARVVPVTEHEVNSYLRFVAPELLPPGVTDPRVRIVGDGRVQGRAVVDLDAVRRARRSDTWLDPVQWLTGRVEVHARGFLRTARGRATFELESAEAAGVPLPKWLLQEIVAYYTQSPEFPEGIDLDAPFDLPARIRDIEIEPRQAFVIQQ